MERLDRAIGTIQWRTTFLEAFVRHLPRIHSDHNPLLVTLLSTMNPRYLERPFRYQTMWSSHVNFEDAVTIFWQGNQESMSHKLECLRRFLKRWNKQVFGHLFRRKAALVRRLDGIYRSMAVYPSQYLCTLEHTLMSEYCLVQEQEEQFWKQKSREQWLKDGDRNTHYFFMSTVTRRRRNKIERLRDDSGIWHYTLPELCGLATRYFQNLFTPATTTSDYSFRRLHSGLLTHSELHQMQYIPSFQDIYAAVFSIGATKAPGIDGIPAHFYQKFWSIVGQELAETIWDCYRWCWVPAWMNVTIITLIPKQSNIQHLSQMRPISLCTTIYKVLAKLIVMQLKPMLPKIIHPNQTSFVPGRNISDNIIIAQELLHRYQLATGRTTYFAWKIDLSKAYDRLRWEFIDAVIQDIGTPNNLKNLIMQCITQVRYRIMVNGALSDVVVPTCGIRQGDPLSPYIFVLCMDKLSRLIDDLVARKLWRSPKAARSGPSISHLFFADDLILFAEASINQMLIVKECLDIFCSWSGQKVNFDKSKLYCSPNTSCFLAQELATICGSPLVSDLGTYLGVPLIHKSTTNQTYSYVIDKVKNRLLP